MTTWSEISPQPCSPQSLLGYGLEVHKQSKAVCLYCGYGSIGKEDEEAQFDLWRQLVVEHIVPHSIANEDNIRGGIQSRFALAGEEETRVYLAINDMNTVTACHFCNTLARVGGKDTSEKNAKEFLSILGCDAAEDRREDMDSPGKWPESLEQTIRQTWALKCARVRPKVVGLRDRFLKQVAPGLGPAFSGTQRRTRPEPRELDKMVYDRIERSAKRAVEILEAACRERGAG